MDHLASSAASLTSLLLRLHFITLVRDLCYLRRKECHVGTANNRVRYSSMESRDSNKHDGVCECGEEVLANDHQQIPRCNSFIWENGDNELAKQSSDKSACEAPAPKTHGCILLRPHSRVVAQANFEREINQNCQSHVVLAKALIQELQVGDTVVSLEANLGDEVHNDDSLDVLEFEYAPHDAIDIPDTIFVLRLVLLLQKAESNRHNDV
ncbi:hypothetical protein HG530_002036 [Fusarium avenaceum]|nr:hypothetical protein HG530_002036 [Fusarium avenaceum]